MAAALWFGTAILSGTSGTEYSSKFVPGEPSLFSNLFLMAMARPEIQRHFP